MKSSGKFLLVLDNIENVVQFDGEFFVKDFVQRLLQECKNLTIMVSSRDEIYFELNPVPHNIDILELDPIYSVKLFLHHTRQQELKASDVFELVEKFPPSKQKLQAFMPGLNEEEF